MNRFSFKVAARYLFAKKSHTAVSIISAISVCAVAVTAMAMVCVLSVYNGFSDFVNVKLSQLDPQIKITAKMGKTIANGDSVMQIVKGVEGIEDVTSTIVDNALAIYGEKQIPIMLKGVSDNYDEMTDINSLVKEDGCYMLSDGEKDFAVLSVGTAVALQAHPGYYVPLDLYCPKRRGAVNPANPVSAFRHTETMVSGVFELEQPEYDLNYVFVSMDVAKRLFDYDTEVMAVEVKLKNDADEKSVMKAIVKQLGGDYVVENRLMQHSESLKMINMEKWITFLLLGFILIIASFNIISTLAILIIEKKENIGTLRSLGASQKAVSKIFVTEGWLISLSGAVVGIVIGLVLCLLQQQFGFIKMSSNSSSLIITSYPVSVEFVDIIAVSGIVALVGFITSFATAAAMRRYFHK